MFTRLEGTLSHVSELPDIPTLENGYTPRALKGVFDRAGEEIREYINTVLLGEIEDKGAESVGVKAIETAKGATVQEILEALALQVQEVANGAIPEGTVTPDKFVPSVASFITEGSPRAMLFSEVGEHIFVPTRSGNYKISVQGAGGGGDTFGTYRIPCGGGSGAFCTGWLRLEKGRSYRVVVGRGGSPITLNEQKKLIASAEKGGASGFYDGESELLFADGGNTRRGELPTARGGLVCIKGANPLISGLLYSDTEYKTGAPSRMGGETVGTATAELGAGGVGASYDLNNGIYSYSGSDGGSGAVLIEWME
ncbi:MAG: hypothetical protein IJP16_05300 [Clostridia bacterium]|nr:hypothetical protein [Clostridia bacterium]